MHGSRSARAVQTFTHFPFIIPELGSFGGKFPIALAHLIVKVVVPFYFNSFLGGWDDLKCVSHTHTYLCWFIYDGMMHSY